jgi:hypothetical protein
MVSLRSKLFVSSVLTILHLLLLLPNPSDGQPLVDVVKAGLGFMSVLPDTNFTNVVIVFTKTDPSDTGSQNLSILKTII